MKAVAMDTAEDSISQTSDEQLVSLQIYVPELIVQKCMQFNREELIWDVKNQILAALPKELKEGFNYGLFCPPVNGRAGKFLDEERPLADYPFTDNSAYVEANLRRLLDHIHNNHVEKSLKCAQEGEKTEISRWGNNPRNVVQRSKKQHMMPSHFILLSSTLRLTENTLSSRERVRGVIRRDLRSPLSNRDFSGKNVSVTAHNGIRRAKKKKGVKKKSWGTNALQWTRSDSNDDGKLTEENRYRSASIMRLD
ncbi:protein shank [Caerostris extrusa]|uniref:Protein shank n=1 Tax=Caerostris extrusa TaxID=172846 RepID=A0AAV4TJX9_CAEEX|nr:protein shank [Caerostris extrusa]